MYTDIIYFFLLFKATVGVNFSKDTRYVNTLLCRVRYRIAAETAIFALHQSPGGAFETTRAPGMFNRRCPRSWGTWLEPVRGRRRVWRQLSQLDGRPNRTCINFKRLVGEAHDRTKRCGRPDCQESALLQRNGGARFGKCCGMSLCDSTPFGWICTTSTA